MKIGVFFGSRSPEHDVSIITGSLIFKELKKLNYEVYAIYVSKEGEWFIGQELADLEFHKNSDFPSRLKRFGGYRLDLNKSTGKLSFVKSTFLNSTIVEIDIAFPAFHGSFGEDGTFQGLCEMFNVAYIGCGVLSSSIAIDKVWTKLFYQRYNFPTTKFIWFTANEWEESSKEILEDISSNLVSPMFIKPAKLGSSIGITKAKTTEEIKNAIEVAFQFDNKVLVEEAVEDLLDLTVCIKGNLNPVASEIQQSNFNNEFFSYSDKYLQDGGTQLGNAKSKIQIPALLEQKTTEEIKQTALEVYKSLECRGIARIDFLFNQVYKKFYVNEINTIPGTFYHHLWRESGYNFEDILRELIEFAIEEQKRKNQLNYIFKSDILNKVSGSKGKF